MPPLCIKRYSATSICLHSQSFSICVIGGINSSYLNNIEVFNDKEWQLLLIENNPISPRSKLACLISED